MEPVPCRFDKYFWLPRHLRKPSRSRWVQNSLMALIRGLSWGLDTDPGVNPCFTISCLNHLDWWNWKLRNWLFDLKGVPHLILRGPASPTLVFHLFLLLLANLDKLHKLFLSVSFVDRWWFWELGRFSHFDCKEPWSLGRLTRVMENLKGLNPPKKKNTETSNRKTQHVL